MSEKRISFTPHGFLLYVEIVFYCIKRKESNTPNETLESIVKQLADDIKSAKDLRSYAQSLSKNTRNYKNRIGSLYHKLQGELNNNDKIGPPILINQNKDIAKYYDFIKEGFNLDIPIREFLDLHITPHFPDGAILFEESFPILTEHIKQLIGTRWYLYYHEYELPVQTRHTVVTRLLLEINSFENVKLYERDENRDFQGKIDLKQSAGNASVIINLEPVHPVFSTKKLQIRILLKEKVTDDRILYGIYIDNEIRDSIVSGTIVLENTAGHLLPNKGISGEIFKQLEDKSRFFRLRKVNGFAVVSVKLAYVSGWEQFIPPEITAYLANKWMNYTKAVSLSPNSNRRRLRLWQEDRDRLKSEQVFRTKFNAVISHDCFLVTPIGDIQSLKELEYYKDINKYLFEVENPNLQNGSLPHDVSKTTKVLQEINFCKLLYTPREILAKTPGYSGGGDSQSIVLNDMAAMKKCRSIIYIIPKPEDILTQHTSALLKIGWAMEQGKTVFIFPLGPDLLPKLFLSPIHNVQVAPPISIEEIPNYICNEYEYLLRP